MLYQSFKAAVFSCCLPAGFFCLQVYFQQVKCILDGVEIRWLTRTLQNIPPLNLKESRVALAVCFGSLSIWTVERCTIDFAAELFILEVYRQFAHSEPTHSEYLLLGSLLLIVDFDSDTPASWGVFSTWRDVVKAFFSLPWWGSYYQSPLLFSVNFQAFLCF